MEPQAVIKTAHTEKPRRVSGSRQPESEVSPEHNLRFLQRSMGNRALGILLQTKLKVGLAGDQYEQEADRVAEQAMRMPAPRPVATGSGDELRRKCRECEEEEATHGQVARKELTGAAVQHGISAPPIVHEVLRSHGQPLDPATRAFFEPRFGYNLGQVRIHTDSRAAASATAINALAYTVGSNLVFGRGRYEPESESGRRLLAHELTHVVQQRGHNIGLQRMPACPAHLADDDPVPAGWQAYHGDTSWFHCGFRVILENRNPTPSDPQQECAYDHSGTLVDENHAFAGCRGTPNQYDSAQHPLLHTFSDTGGIWQAGGPAFMTSRVYTLSRPIAAAIQVATTAGQVIRSVAEGFERAIALGVLAATASVDPGNWRFVGLSARSIRHLNVMGAILGSAALSGDVNTLLRNLTRRLDSFAISGLLDEMAEDINRALPSPVPAAPVTPSQLGELSLIQLVEWLRTQGLLQYVRLPEDIAREQFAAQSNPH
jgi:Domain of unknown function (DUF4157)